MASHLLLTSLFQKYIDNRCSPSEMDQLVDLLKDPANKALAETLIGRQIGQKKNPGLAEAALDERLERRLQHILNTPGTVTPTPRISSIKRIYKWVAAASIIIIAGTGAYFWRDAMKEKSIVPIASVEVAMNPSEPADYTRSIVLPDGSTVILKKGSTLKHTQNGRQVELAGEAYFDVVHDESRPFIIQTGNIKTTVLGTAFNIRAFPEQKDIAVSVTRGKVKVEKGAEVLAILTEDQQVVYSLEKDASDKKLVNATSVVTDWTKLNMDFEDKSFGEITNFLEKRFGVTISYVNPLLEACTITASFDGTEPLEKILAILCQVRPAKFTMEGDRVVIDGEPCKQ